MAIATTTPAQLLTRTDKANGKAANVGSVTAEPSFDDKLKVLREKDFKIKESDYTGRHHSAT